MFELAEIIDAIPYTHCYLIASKGRPLLPATALSGSGSMLPIGSRDASMFAAGTLVFAYFSDDYPYAIILGAVPQPAAGANTMLPDSIAPGAQTGFFAEAMESAIYKQDNAGGLFDWSAGRPLDNLPGDWGHLNEYGIGMLIGRLMTFMRASEFCKLEMFLPDNLARLAAYNYQMFTAGSALDAMTDEGAWSEISGFTPYEYEALGTVTGAAPFSTQEAKPGNGLLSLEPQDPEQVAFHRYREIKGYLGDLLHRYVVAPHPSLEIMKRYPTDEDPKPAIGLFREVIGIDGRYHLQSAKEIVLEKTLWIPVPVERRRRDNPEGDKDLELIPEEPTQEYPRIGGGEDDGREFDQRAYLRARMYNLGLRTNKKDWHIPDVPAMPGDIVAEGPALSPYSTARAPDPTQVAMQVDPKYATTRFFAATAGIKILEDGGVSISDGYGSRILLSGGNIEITCPGDVILRPGRDVLGLVGRNTNIASHGDVALSSSDGDLRLKAEKKLMALGGNGGFGGVLIESRGEGLPNAQTALQYLDDDGGASVNLGGILLKSAKGAIASWGKHIYTKSIGQGIVIDGNEGKDVVAVHGSNIDVLAQGAVIETCRSSANPTEGTTSVRTHSYGGTVYSTPGFTLGTHTIQLGGKQGEKTQILLNGSMIADGGITLTGGLAENAERSESLIRSIARMAENIVKTLKSGVTTTKNAINAAWGEQYTFGNSATYDYVGTFFSPTARTVAEDFMLIEAPWQTAMRRGGSPAPWVEPEVPAYITTEGGEGRITRPFPGQEGWETEEMFKQVENTLYQFTENGMCPLDTSSESYDNIEGLAEPTEAVPLKDAYVTNT